MAQTTNVRFYSGAKGDEKPVSILVDGEEKMIVHIYEEAVEEDVSTGERTRRFKVRTEDGASFAVRQMGKGWVVSPLASVDKMG
jgi:hypothetical protein